MKSAAVKRRANWKILESTGVCEIVAPYRAATVAQPVAVDERAAYLRSFNIFELIGSLVPNSLYGCFEAAV